MRLFVLGITLLCVILSSCSGSSSVRDQVAFAETALAEQNYEESRNLCDEILGSKDRKTLSSTEYARMSILYMQFYENSDDSDALEQAVECYREAVELNADSARIYYDSLSAEDHKYAYALSMIVDGIDNPKETGEDHDRYVSPDSVGVLSEIEK